MKCLFIVALLLFVTISCANGNSCLFLNLRDFEEYAEQNLPKGLRDYLQRGAGDDTTLRGNIKGFEKIKILPRYLRDVSNRTTKVEILGQEFSMPIGISPSGLHKRWHVEGENATARAVKSSGSIMIVSAASSTSFAEFAEASPESVKWQQTFIYRNVSITIDFVRRAEAAGFKGIVLSVDMPVKALRYQNQRNQYRDNFKMVNLEAYQDLGDEKKLDSATWEDVREIVDATSLPIIIKGLLTADDVLLAKQYGAKGAIISNHGGRQLDGAVSTIEALIDIGEQHPELIKDDNFDIYLDGGVRSGLDVFKALAYGAKFVFVGRPPMWGLYQSGQQGVEAVLEILRKELETVMGQSGCDSIACIRPSLVKYTP